MIPAFPTERLLPDSRRHAGEETEEELLTLSPEDMLNITQVSNEKRDHIGTKWLFFWYYGGYIVSGLL